jgi:hypothetical protein
MGSTTTETTNRAGSQSAEASRMLGLMSSVSADAASQMGDLTDIAAGNIKQSPYLMQQIARLQQIAGEQGRNQMEQNMQGITRQVEDTAIGRNIEGSSMEAIMQAIAGTQQLRDLNAQSLQQEAQGVNMGIQIPRQDAALALQGNQALLQRLVGGAQAVLPYDAQIRELNSSRTQVETQDWGSQILNGAMQFGANMALPGIGGVLPSMAGVPGQMGPGGTVYQGPTQ